MVISSSEFTRLPPNYSLNIFHSLDGLCIGEINLFGRGDVRDIDKEEVSGVLFQALRLGVIRISHNVVFPYGLITKYYPW